MRKSTSEQIKTIGTVVRSAFARHDALATVHLNVPPVPRAGASAGELMVAMAKAAAMQRPEDAARDWAKSFRDEIRDQTARIDELAEEGIALSSIVKFLRGTGYLSDTLSSDLRAAAITVKESTDPTLPLSVARRMETAIQPGADETKRLKSYVARCRSACEVSINKRLADFFAKCGPVYANDVRVHEKALAEAREKNHAIKVKVGRTTGYEEIEE